MRAIAVFGALGALLLAMPGLARSEPGTLRGEVRNNLGSALPDAALRAPGGAFRHELRGEKAFELELAPGRYVLLAEAFGYRKVRRIVDVKAGEVTEADFVLNSLIHHPFGGSSLDGATGHGLRSTYQVLDTPLPPIQTRANGAFGGYLPQGRFRLAFTAPGYHREVVTAVVPGKPVVLNLKPRVEGPEPRP